MNVHQAAKVARLNAASAVDRLMVSPCQPRRLANGRVERASVWFHLVSRFPPYRAARSEMTPPSHLEFTRCRDVKTKIGRSPARAFVIVCARLSPLPHHPLHRRMLPVLHLDPVLGAASSSCPRTFPVFRLVKCNRAQALNMTASYSLSRASWSNGWGGRRQRACA